MVWKAGMFCCHQRAAPGLLQSSSPASSDALGVLQHSLGSGDRNSIFWFHCCLPGTGQSWAQCGAPSAPCLVCVGSSAVFPLRDSLCPLLPGCFSLARAAEEPSAAAGPWARAGPSSRSHLPPPCLLWTEPAPRSRGRTFTLGFHQGWVTRRGPRGKEGAQPALPGGCCLGLGQPLAGSLGTAPLQWVLFVHGVPGMASWSGGAHLGGLLQLEGLNPLGCEAWRGSKGCHGVGAWQGEQRGAMARLEAVGSVLAGGLWLPWLHQAFRGKILKSAGQHFWPDPIISSANPLGPPKQFVSCFSSSPISWDPTSHLPSM